MEKIKCLCNKVSKLNCFIQTYFLFGFIISLYNVFSLLQSGYNNYLQLFVKFIVDMYFYPIKFIVTLIVGHCICTPTLEWIALVVAIIISILYLRKQK